MTSPWEQPGPNPVLGRLAQAPPPEAPPSPSPLHDPARLIAIVGSVLAIVASPLPWLTRVGNPPPEVRTGWTGTADGFLLATVAIVLLVMAVSRVAEEARSRGLRLLPAGLGLLAAILGFGSQRTLENQVAIWTSEGATGVYEPWFYLNLLGAGLACVGGLWLGIRRGRRPAAPSDPTDAVQVTRRGVATALFGGLGVVLGAGVSATVVLTSGLNDVAMSMPLLFAVLIGALFGGWVGSRFAGLLFADPNALARPRDEGVRLEKVGTATVASRHARRDEPAIPGQDTDAEADA